jgi:hypothetical protein
VADLAAEIEQLERDGWAALSGPNGFAFYERMMVDDGLMVFPSVVMDKVSALDAIRRAEPWSTHELTNVHVAGDQRVALIAYRAVATRGTSSPYTAEMSSVYVRRSGGWRLLLHQQSPG